MLNSIQCFRGIAALMVVAYHVSIGLGDPRHFGFAAFSSFTWRLNIGVDFFFVLSGFIIMLAHEADLGKPRRFIPFLIKRFRRIYPTYWVYVGAFCLLLLLGVGTHAARPATPAQWISTFVLIRFDTFILPIAPAWTLIHEVAFYSAFAAAILNRRIGIAIFLTWQVMCLASLSFPEDAERSVFATYFSTMNLEFLIGILAYIGFRRGVSHPALVTAGGAFLLGTLLALEARFGPLFCAQLMYAFGFGLVICGAAALERQGYALRYPALMTLGAASYSLYLTHVPVIGVVLKLLGLIVPSTASGSSFAFFMTLMATVVAGIAGHYCIEKPLLKALGGSRRRRVTSVAGSQPLT